MRAVLYCLSVAIILCGCDALNTPKVENPVMGPPPPRKAGAPAAGSVDLENPLYPRRVVADASGTEPGSIEKVDFETTEITGTTVVAKVNGAPIFASEVLEQFAGRLAQAAEKIPARELNRAKLDIIRRGLDSHVERKLLAEALKSTLEAEQVEMLDGHIDALFEQEMENMKERFGVRSRHELEIKAGEQGTSLVQLRDAFALQLMAREFLRNKAGAPPHVGRQEMLDYYREHADEYEFPAQVRWQQVLINFRRQGGKTQALERLELAVAELRSGADFSDVAGRYSDGPRAEQGGMWDWTQAGSLTDTEVEDTLFRLPPGTISSVMEGKNDFRLVKVLQVREQGRTPFEEVQNDIKKLIVEDIQQQTIKNVLADMKERAIVITIFDEQAEGTL